MGAAARSGFRWPSLCKGQCECTTCHFRVVSGVNNLIAAGPKEIELLRPVTRRYPSYPADWVRLACQAFVTGDVVVQKLGVVPFEGL
jgi:2Fe-2S ferredoxin